MDSVFSSKLDPLHMTDASPFQGTQLIAGEHCPVPMVRAKPLVVPPTSSAHQSRALYFPVDSFASSRLLNRTDRSPMKQYTSGFEGTEVKPREYTRSVDPSRG